MAKIKKVNIADYILKFGHFDSLQLLEGKDEDETIKVSKSNSKRTTNRAERRRNSNLAKQRKMTRLFTNESDERKLRIIGKEIHEWHNGWYTEKEVENRRKALRGPFAKCELHIPEPNISKVKVYVH